MRKRKFILIISVILLVLAIKVDAIQDKVIITDNSFNKKDDTIIVKLSIPKISGMGNKQKEKIINDNFYREANGIYKTVEKQAKEDYIQAKKDNLYFMNYEVNYEYLVTYNFNGVLSMPVDIYTYVGGAHGITDKKSNNFDVITGEKIGLDDLFKPGYDYKSTFDKVIKEEINKNKDFYFEGSFKGVKSDTDYYLTDTGVVIYFQLYEIAPYAAGIPEFVIPYSKLESGLRYKLSK